MPEAAKELDYRPSPAGRSLVRGRGDIIVALVPNSTIGENQQDALDRLTVNTAGMGGNVVLRFVGPDSDETAASILALRPLAVIDLGAALSTASRERLAQQGVPTVPRLGIGENDSIRLDVSISHMQVAELIRTGPRRIVYASLRDRRPDPYSPMRFVEIERACSKAGIMKPVLIDVPVDPDGAYQAVAGLLQEGGVVGVAAYNDTVAAAVAHVATRLGLSIPDDVSIVGVDNTPIAQLLTPRLTTIDVNMDALMDRAVEDLANELNIPLPIIPIASNDTMLRLVRGQSS
ncbi:DNA-binding LacI/PurR family transcriptional regulator [Pseudarthrobacter sp. SLBN-100]|uniref:substrate-binding domain-containing protein n=1 Tax=Arthrobacter sp. SLBN-100 TaxID=2768450 RepID=UPI001F3BAB4D|nr:LacI family DNA-binding transcriptional regulator [Arthrobacter sp. SLBN-100]